MSNVYRCSSDRWTDDAVRAVADLRSSAASVGGWAPGRYPAGGGPAHPQPYIHKGNSTGRAPLHVHTALAAEHCPPQQLVWFTLQGLIYTEPSRTRPAENIVRDAAMKECTKLVTIS